MFTEQPIISRRELLVINLCDEIDQLREERDYWRDMYKEEQQRGIKELNERFEETKRGVGQALMFALTVQDNPDGSLSISKEDRLILAEQYKEH